MTLFLLKHKERILWENLKKRLKDFFFDMELPSESVASLPRRWLILSSLCLLILCMPKMLNAQQSYSLTLKSTERVLQNLLGYSKTLEQRLEMRQLELTQLSDQLGMVSEELKKAKQELEDSKTEVQVIVDLLKKSQDKQKMLSGEFETYKKDSQKVISDLRLERDAAMAETKIYKGATIGISVAVLGAGTYLAGKYVFKWW